MKLKEWINILIIILLLGISYYRYKNKTYSFSKTQILMDTQIEIFAVSKNKNLSRQIDQAFRIIEMYEEKFSYFDSNSFLYKINNSDSEKHAIYEEFYEILKLSEKIYHESNHLYDVSIANLTDIWDFHGEVIPDLKTIEEAKQNIGFDKVKYDEKNLYLPANIKLNFGSISKGFIIDKVIEFLINNGVMETYVNAGGDLRFYSNNRKKWKIGIQHPRDRYSTIATLNIPDMAVVTSGDYERYFIFNDERYHHIINPATGFPAKPTVAVTIISKTAFLADALSTAAFVMNPFDAIDLIKSYPDTEGIIYFYDENKEPVSLKTGNIKKWLVSDKKTF